MPARQTPIAPGGVDHQGGVYLGGGSGLHREQPHTSAEEAAPAAVREFFLPVERWPEVLGAVRDQPFRDYLVFMLSAGSRPQEIRKIEARHFEAKNNRIIFPTVESKGKRKQRVIYLDAVAFEIIERLSKELPAGPIFLDTKGEPWNKDSIKCRFQRLQAKLKIPGLCATSLRR